MRRLTFIAACAVSSALFASSAATSGQPGRASGRARVVLDNARVRVFKTTRAAVASVAHGSGVAVPLQDGPTRKKGDAYWVSDNDKDNDTNPTGADAGPLIFVEPKPSSGPPPPPVGSKPGNAVFVGMSFKTLFENERVTAIRARMDEGAREGFHTHGSDTIVVHLSGGAIEDTANGKTKVDRWKPGDVEFESRGSSHSARNVGKAVDVVLVALKP